jgi:acetyltransferase
MKGDRYEPTRPGSTAATKVHRRYWRINETAARWLSHDAQPASRRLQWPGAAGDPAWKAVLGVLAWPTIESLPFTPDLAVLCTNARRNLELLEALGQKGCKTCIILSSQPEQYPALLECAARYQMRLLGPNSLGLLAPWQGLNASFSPVPIHRGKLAFISQSAAVSNTILDWAQQREMGFSYFIALGDSLDIDVDDLLDFLARDSKTSAILLYLEHLSDARRFVSAARSARETSRSW